MSVCWASFFIWCYAGCHYEVPWRHFLSPSVANFSTKFWKVYWLEVKFAYCDCCSVETTKTQQKLITYIAKNRCKLWFSCLLCRSFLLLLNYSSKNVRRTVWTTIITIFNQILFVTDSKVGLNNGRKRVYCTGIWCWAWASVTQTYFWGRFVEEKLMISSSFSCDKNYSCQRYDFSILRSSVCFYHTLLCCVSLT